MSVVPTVFEFKVVMENRLRKGQSSIRKAIAHDRQSLQTSGLVLTCSVQPRAGLKQRVILPVGLNTKNKFRTVFVS